MKKLITIVISVFVLLYFGTSLVLLSQGLLETEPISVKIYVFLIGLFIVTIMGAMIATLITRLKEIDKEDKNDLSKYWLYIW